MIKDSDRSYGYDGMPEDSSEKTVEQAPQFKCCICDRSFVRETTTVFPFCSVRCQQIDLGRWYNEDYALPLDGQEEQEFEADEES